jgi:hypothetical protein
MNAPTNPEELPPPELKLLVTDNLDPENSTSKGQTVNWIVGKAHPFMPTMTIEAMFVSRNAVAVYVYSSSGSNAQGARDVIPMRRVRLAHERMALEVLAEEINASAAGDDPYVYDDDNSDDTPDDEAPESTPVVDPPPNGQPSP